jgi:hypothetical protein
MVLLCCDQPELTQVQSATVIFFLFGLSGNIQLIPLGSSLGALIIFVLIEKYVAVDPIVPLTVLQNRGALLSCVSQLGFSESWLSCLFPSYMLPTDGAKVSYSG